jgi:hypothetical protein
LHTQKAAVFQQHKAFVRLELPFLRFKSSQLSSRLVTVLNHDKFCSVDRRREFRWVSTMTADNGARRRQKVNSINTQQFWETNSQSNEHSDSMLLPSKRRG